MASTGSKPTQLAFTNNASLADDTPTPALPRKRESERTVNH